MCQQADAASIETERRELRRTVAWVFRCPARHQISITVRGYTDPGPYRDLFASLHQHCGTDTPEAAA